MFPRYEITIYIIAEKWTKKFVARPSIEVKDPFEYAERNYVDFYRRMHVNSGPLKFAVQVRDI